MPAALPRTCTYILHPVQGKRIRVLPPAAAAARAHRLVIQLGTLAFTCAHVALLGVYVPYILQSAPPDAAAPSSLAITAAVQPSSAATHRPHLLPPRVVRLPLVLLDVLATAFLIPFVGNLLASTLCATLVRRRWVPLKSDSSHACSIAFRPKPPETPFGRPM